MIATARLLSALCASGALLAACEQRPTDPPQPNSETAAVPGTESSKDFGDYVVHFNALSTEQLMPEVARQYGIVRSKSRAMLNVSILKKEPDSMGTPVPGSVSASAVNLNGQLKTMTFREISEGTAIYYISEIPVTDEETLIFTIDVTPINEASRFSVRYKKTFFVD